MGTHLVQAERRLRRLARAQPPGALTAESEQGRAVIVARNDGSVDLCTQQARRFLQDYFRVDLPRARLALPTPIVQWLAPAIEAWTTRRFLGARPDPLIVAKETRCLVVSVVPDPVHDRHLLTLAEEALAAPPATLRDLGLTPREAEVLSWVAQGKTNGEVGVILGTSSRTVQKHLEHIFQKLGVESRTSAILCAWQVGQLRRSGGRTTIRPTRRRLIGARSGRRGPARCSSRRPVRLRGTDSAPRMQTHGRQLRPVPCGERRRC